MDQETKIRFTTESDNFLLSTKMGTNLLFLRRKENRTNDKVYTLYKKWNNQNNGKLFLLMIEKYCAISLNIPEQI